MFVVVSSSWPRMWEIIDSLGSPNVGLARIWPVTEEAISWPRPFTLNDTSAEQLPTYLVRVAEHAV